MAWIMSTRRVVGGIEALIGNVRVGLIEWESDTTFLTLPGHNRFEVGSTSQGLKQIHAALNSPPPEDASIGGRL